MNTFIILEFKCMENLAELQVVKKSVILIFVIFHNCFEILPWYLLFNIY